MPRIYYVNGEALVQVLGPPGSTLLLGSQLGLSSTSIKIILHVHSEALTVDPYGKDNPVDEQVFGGQAEIEMELVHFNPIALAECVRLTFPGANFEGNLGS